MPPSSFPPAVVKKIRFVGVRGLTITGETWRTHDPCIADWDELRSTLTLRGASVIDCSTATRPPGGIGAGNVGSSSSIPHHLMSLLESIESINSDIVLNCAVAINPALKALEIRAVGSRVTIAGNPYLKSFEAHLWLASMIRAEVLCDALGVHVHDSAGNSISGPRYVRQCIVDGAGVDYCTQLDVTHERSAIPLQQQQPALPTDYQATVQEATLPTQGRCTLCQTNVADHVRDSCGCAVFCGACLPEALARGYGHSQPCVLCRQVRAPPHQQRSGA